MTEPVAKPTRRLFVAGSLAAAGVAGGLLPSGTARAATAYTLSADGIAIVAQTDGTLVVSDGAGTERVRIAHFQVKDTVLGNQRTFGGTPSVVTLADGRQAIRVEYRMGAAAPGITVTGTFDVTARRLHVRWDATSSNTMYLNSQFHRTVVNASEPERPTAMTRWNRDPGGGVPYETNDGIVYASAWPDLTAYFRLESSRPAWTTPAWMHIVGTYDALGVLRHEADLVLGNLRPAAANAAAVARPVGVDLWTDQPFNLYEVGAAMPVRAQVVNGGPSAASIQLSWFARDFDGRKLAGGSSTLTLAAGESTDRTLTVPALDQQGIAFVEVKASANGAEAFARTTLATLPPYEYQGGGIFGIANYPWLLEPSKDDVAALMQRIGVALVRIAYEGAPGIAPAELRAMGIMTNIQHGDVVFDSTPEQAKAWAAELVDVVVDAGARYFEVDNERNQPWMSGLYADKYIRDGLRPVVERLAEVGSDVKVMNNGLGGMDVNWTDNFHAAGGWDLIDVFAFHPGRGNFTPDYAPTPAEWVTGDNGTYWNFLGSVREAKRRISEYGGGKELWLTEAYACTRPNYWWNDTMRQAAENVLLTMALCKAEGVDGVNWYQLHDSTIHHPQEAVPSNTEYHFGLTNRDLSAKPSLLAFATGTRLLEEAEFVRWLDFSAVDRDLHGLLFETPDGPVSILWSRKDGYLLNADHAPNQPYYPHPEAWQDDWPSKTTLVIPRARITETDCVGRSRVLDGKNGRVTFQVDGAPRIYHGLSARPEQLVRRG
ncbi:hypothetical protein FB561_1277 [Kribbella amoyensis]|uniref:Uncharacterized protein n=1 Tax=Kribbella amoyensis TaxID=996641 RepID=A0A561BMY9_9ACTN|nr:hypothetical protein [Kribbella amoyensis]TWD80204.1 hypothetical protein FB561_1277 [Kribbella amoyensis]